MSPPHDFILDHWRHLCWLPPIDCCHVPWDTDSAFLLGLYLMPSAWSPWMSASSRCAHSLYQGPFFSARSLVLTLTRNWLTFLYTIFITIAAQLFCPIWPTRKTVLVHFLCVFYFILTFSVLSYTFCRDLLGNSLQDDEFKCQIPVLHTLRTIRQKHWESISHSQRWLTRVGRFSGGGFIPIKVDLPAFSNNGCLVSMVPFCLTREIADR